MAKPSFVNTTMMGSPVYPVFINNPVIVTIKAGDFQPDSSFRQIVVKVIADGQTLPFRAEVQGQGDTVVFDISSSLRALYGLNTHPANVTASGVRTNAKLFTVQAYHSYVQNGESIDDTGNTISRSGYMLPGGLDENELTSSTMNAATTLTYKRSAKPTTGEVAWQGSPYFTTSWNTPTGEVPYLITTLLTNNTAGSLTIEGRSVYINKIYGVMDSAVTLAFENKFGVLETAYAYCKAKATQKSTRENLRVYSAPSYVPSDRRTSIITKGAPIMELTSGLVDSEWAAWWANDFLCAERHWIYSGGKWLECQLEADTQTLLDQQKQEYLSIDFKLSFVKSGRYSL